MSNSSAFSGRVSLNPRGFGFVTEEESAARPAPRSAFVTPPDLNPFLAGDLVNAEVTEAPDGRLTASKLTLVQRSRRALYGVAVAHRKALFLKVDREVSNTDWPLDKGGLDVAPGDHVVARLDGARLVATEVLESPDARAVAQVVARYGIPTAFDAECLAEVERVRSIPHASAGRRDLRAVPTLTIDAPRTRDIDDAVAVIPAGPDGALRLLVSIADVGAFVPEGGALDRAARDRATSVYLAGCTLPMLPEGLSSEYISLLPGVDRACLTCEMRIDPEGNVTAVDVYTSLLRSWVRASYDEVADFLDRGVVSDNLQPVRDTLPWLRTVSARIGLARARRGGVSLARDEARVHLDAAGEPTAVVSEGTTSAHVLIERSMVAANEAIGQWLVDRGLPGLYRVHDEPTPARVGDLAEFARNFGFAPGFGPRMTPLVLEAFDRQIAGAPWEEAMRAVLARVLGPARYDAQPTAHFGLAAPVYLHFTSPIRRYADLVVHRIVRRYLEGDRTMTAADPSLDALAQHINTRAYNAARAETDRHRTLTARYMAGRLGEAFAARVTQLRPFGVWVQLDGVLVEGAVPYESLPGGPFAVDARGGAAVGPGGRWEVGQALTVVVAQVDEGLGRVEFALRQ